MSTNNFFNSSTRVMLLTGASGFIGSEYLKHALATGWKVRVLTRDPAKYSQSNDIEIFEGDFATCNDWKQAIQDVDVVVNLAAELNDVDQMMDVNFFGPSRLLDAAIKLGVKRWIQMSSVGAYGPVSSGVVNEDCLDRPVGPYEVSKVLFDSELKERAAQCSMKFCIIRPSNVYGKNMRNKSIFHLMNMISKGWFMFIGPFGASANYVHVDDVVQALDLCVTNPRAMNTTYIVSAWATMETMINSLASGMDVIKPRRRVNLYAAKLLAYLLQSWASWPLTVNRVNALSSRSKYSTKRIEDHLDWKVNVSVESGMNKFAKETS